MSRQSIFTGWSNITLEDLVVAYRKAKADCFFENTFPAAIKFAEYEQSLLENLKALLEILQAKNSFLENKDLLGDFRLMPKKLSVDPKPGVIKNGHAHFSSPQRAVEDLLRKNKITPEFRIIGDFPVNSHIISALWINMIGRQFDAKLENSCYGARLKRLRNDEMFSDKEDKPFHISSIGSFAPYFQPYQKWRNDGLKAIRGELEKDRDVMAVSLDLKAYYHFIDPIAITSEALYEELGLDLSDEEKLFNSQLAAFLSEWAQGASTFSKKIAHGDTKIEGGLVIGLTASRIISNALLHRWDRLISERLTPIYYGRYVDDMFLVLRDPGNIMSSQEFMIFLQQRLGKDFIVPIDSGNEQIWSIEQGEKFQGNTKIKLQSNKQKLFLLQGRAGLDLLDSIEKEIHELSSEHRLMPSPDQLDNSTAARVLSAAGTVGENADTLRRADGLTIRRLSWSLQLRHVEMLARDLPPHEWAKQREEFYQFAHNHILRPDNLFAHFSYLPRLLGFAISMNEWQQAEKIAVMAYKSLDDLAAKVPEGKDVVVNGTITTASKNLWRIARGTLTWIFIDSAARHYDPGKLFSVKRQKKEQQLANLFLTGIFDSLVEVEKLLKLKFGAEDFDKKAPMVALSDLAKVPYKRILKSQAASHLTGRHDGKMENEILSLMQSSELLDTEILKEFRKSTRNSRLAFAEKGKRKKESYFPYIFPTRPLTPAEISELAPECIGLKRLEGKPCKDLPSVIWAKYTQALRGVWIKPTLLAIQQDDDIAPDSTKLINHLRIGTDKRHKVIVALTNFKTEKHDWDAMACNRPNLSRERYRRISDLVNQTIQIKPKPDYVLFPELSLPVEWIDSVASRLSAAGISLIAGAEYKHFNNDQILSEACLVLTDNRLGYPATVKIWQPKLEPAVGEDKDLTTIFGKSWATSKIRNKHKPIYIHNDFHFGIMVCSELQNSKDRIKFQGKVDALIVLSWNQDLETFSSLIESAALDVHAYTILVNNRQYGDSRVRSPAKQSFNRDIARVRGGANDFVIAAALDIDELRAFQSRAKRWPQENDKFKPVPEGFILLNSRKHLPPK